MSALSSAPVKSIGSRSAMGLIAYVSLSAGGLLALTHWLPLGQPLALAALALSALLMALGAYALYRRPSTAHLAAPFLLLSAFVLLRVWVFLPASPQMFADSPGYLSPPSLRLYWRPFTVPLVYHLMQGGLWKIVAVQFLLGTATWSALAIAGINMLRASAGRYALPALLLLFSLSHSVVRWEAFILSEALTHSLLLLTFVLALCLHLRIRARQAIGKMGYATVALLALSLFLALNARDSIVYMLPIALSFFALYAWTHRPPRAFVAVTAALLVCLGALDLRMTSLSMRWVDPIANIIFIRVLPDAERTAFFVRHGMPDDAVMRSFSGRYWWHIIPAYGKTHTAFRTWLDTRGKSTYMAYMLAHPFEVNREVLASLPTTFDMRNFRQTHLHDEPGQLFSRLSHDLDRLFFFRLPGAWFAPLWAAIVAGLCLVPVAGSRALAGWTLFLLASAYSQIFIGYHGDAADESRHMILGQIMFRLSLISGLFYLWGLRGRIRRPLAVPRETA